MPGKQGVVVVRETGMRRKGCKGREKKGREGRDLLEWIVGMFIM